MAQRIGWRREGSKTAVPLRRRRTGRRITDAEKLERIRALCDPRRRGRTSGSHRARRRSCRRRASTLAGRKQYLYHPEYRARQEQAKYDKLIRFAEKLPELREAMSEHMELPRSCRRKKVAAVAGPADQSRLVPGRRRSLCEIVTNLRDHDAAQVRTCRFVEREFRFAIAASTAS